MKRRFDVLYSTLSERKKYARKISKKQLYSLKPKIEDYTDEFWFEIAYDHWQLMRLFWNYYQQWKRQRKQVFLRQLKDQYVGQVIEINRKLKKDYERVVNLYRKELEEHLLLKQEVNDIKQPEPDNYDELKTLLPKLNKLDYDTLKVFLNLYFGDFKSYDNLGKKVNLSKGSAHRRARELIDLGLLTDASVRKQ